MGYDRKEDGLRTDGSKGHVLVADDAPFITKQISKMLTDDGFLVVDVLHNGEDLIKVYKEKYPDIDLVTLDITMPKMDGITTLEQILAFDKDAHVVMVTANDNTSVVRKAIALGAKNFIVKPLKPEAVLSRLRSSVRK
ncbi:response regulator [Treponema ruminis]|uniref:Two-component system chemotaxis response regulator CheY n=1 Tax=Treponema ruminis TaxID=744515 RepID=A0A7W8G9T6_9SPIR|nr:response regulator [Treponema ruminis]MBB5226405.1 two-component system chemotaxis response regulator CheY [Treponema ruminis]QSI02690.1 response regulator [Treponema ruminis]